MGTFGLYQNQYTKFQNKMSFDKIKSLWRTGSTTSQAPTPTTITRQQSFIDRTQSFITNSFRRSTITTLVSTSQFDDYLATLPQIKKIRKKVKSSATDTLKPELLKRVLEVVQPQYFNEAYQIDGAIFDRKTRANSQKQLQMQEQLDEIEVCLFNQISSRFDEILSVLRTIETLDFLVVENQRKIRSIREDNLSKVIKVSEKQIHLTRLIARKRRIETTLQLAGKLKLYRRFLEQAQQIETAESLQQFYSTIPTVKTNISIYTKLRCSRNAMLRIEEAEGTLKRSFSDKVNERIFQYLKKDIPYTLDFWKKYINSPNILEDKKDQSRDNTALLDESALMGAQQQGLVILPKKQQNTENSIIEYLKKGWQDGEYSVNKLKSDIDTLLKSKHNSFLLDFRNFCDQVCKKNDKTVQNPSLTNLLKEIGITFCVKVYGYFFDIHKSLLLRYFSTCRKIYQLILQLSSGMLTIDQKQKLKVLAEGCANSGSFLVRLIVEKLLDIIDTKVIHEGIDISEIKQIVGVLENAELFLEKQILLITTMSGCRESFLAEFFSELQNRFPLKIVEVGKKRKLMDYLNKMHKNALTVQLKQSLQNEIWQPTDIPIFYYDSLHYLITGQSLNLRSTRNKHNLKNPQQSSMMYETSVLMDGREESFLQEPSKLVSNFRIIRNDIIINGQTYKVTQTLLLLLEILEDYMALAQNFPILKNEIGIRINEIIRSYNVSSCQLIVHAGAVALQKIKTKNITSRHLALSSLCLSFIIYVMECLEKRVEILDYGKLRQSLEEHTEIIVKKLNQILVYKATTSKADINLKNTPSKGTQSIVSNTKILLQILSDYYGKEILNKIFTKEVLSIYVDAISALQVGSRVEAEALKDDVAFFFGELKALEELDNDFGGRRLKAEDVVRKAFQEL